MHRKKPASAKQRKAELQLKRAIKRGDVAPEITAALHKKRAGRPRPNTRTANENAIIDSSRKLQSSFVKLSPEFLSTTKQLASSITLVRPIPIERTVFFDPSLNYSPSQADSTTVRPQPITVLKRPKWNYEMSKTMVEKNEEGVFKKWLEDTDKACGTWQPLTPETLKPTPTEESIDNEANREDTSDDKMPSSAPLFERNLEVWRQLWRVTEISQILLILLDSRCPLLHYPTSLHNYFSTFRPPHRIIFVLTKADITGSERVNFWREHLSSRYPGIRIVQVESYVEKIIGAGQGQRKFFDPHIPSELKRSLVDALKAAHDELLAPPDAIKSNPQRLKEWKPRVTDDVNWEAVLNAGGEDLLAHRAQHIVAATQDAAADVPGAETDIPPFLTVGLIGQPNVGKSSLLNALFGARKVKASRTPGKTKHFQTMFWTPQIRLVDCPGLVFPVSSDMVSMEMQVLAGVFPIAHVPSMPACVHYAARLLPLERMFSLQHPSLKEPAEEDKRTWRDGKRPQKEVKEVKDVRWTTMNILSAFADAKGWVTAKAGRPDVSRAGNAILRTLAEGRIQWAFYPPGTDIAATSIGRAGAYDGQGVWIQSDAEFDIHRDSDAERDDDEEDESGEEEALSASDDASEEKEEGTKGDSEGEGEEDASDEQGVSHGSRRAGMEGQFKTGMFAALALEDGDDEQ